MQALELRLGNTVKTTEGLEEVTVELLGLIEYKSEKVEAIVLTREILENMGFVEHNQTGNYKIPVGYYTNGNGDEKQSTLKIKQIKHSRGQNQWRVENFANKTIYIHSVHQLQNLYFALTGKDLELNL